MAKRQNNQLPNNLPQLQNLIKRDAESYKEEFQQQFRHFQYVNFKQCFGSGSDFFLSPDRPKIWIRIREKNVLKVKTGVKVEKSYISYLALDCPFWSGSSKTLSKPSFRSHKCINGRIRILTFKTLIRISEKTRIHLDPNH